MRVAEDIESSSWLCPYDLSIILELYTFIVIVTSELLFFFFLILPGPQCWPHFPFILDHAQTASGALVRQMHHAHPSFSAPLPTASVLPCCFSSPAVTALLLQPHLFMEVIDQVKHKQGLGTFTEIKNWMCRPYHITFRSE